MDSQQAERNPVFMESVLLIRHGQTVWNASSRWQGWADIELSDNGRLQAEAGAAELKGLLDSKQVVVVSSDLRRAAETASAIAAELGTTVSATLPDLKERNIGDWSGKTTEEIEHGWPGQLEAWRLGQLAMTPNGESEDFFFDRTSRALTKLAQEAQAEDKIVIAVCHGGVIRTLTRSFDGDPRPVGNLDGAWFAIRDGSLAHLGDFVSNQNRQLGTPDGKTGTSL